MTKKFFPSLVFRFFPFFLIIPIIFTACAPTGIKMPEFKPDIIKVHKSVGVYAGFPGMHDSKVWVKKGDYITIIAKGSVDVWPGRSGYASGPENRLLYRMGKEGYAGRYISPSTFVSGETGAIYLGYAGSPTDYRGEATNPSWYRDDQGAFIVDIIVWQKDDPVAIADFFEEVSRHDPKNENLKKVAQEFLKRREIVLAEAKAKKEAEEAQKAITALKKKETSPVKEIEKEQQIAELDEKLKKALQAMKELEELKKNFAEQKEKERELTTRLERLEEKAIPGSNPPVMAIASPKDGITVDYEYIPITGVAEDEEGIVKFEILVNQQPVSRKDQRDLQLVAKDLRRIDFSEKIRLREGKNEISVIAHDNKGLSTQKTISVHFARKKEEVWAAVIGINKYKNLPSLKYAANDAREFYRYLVEVNRIPKDHIWLLLDEEATLDKLRSTLGTHLRRQAGRDDTVIIFLAGHGATEKDASSPDGDGLEKYILPHNADPKDLYASAMPMNEISRIFQRISSERLIFISDTCYSGASGGRTVPATGIRANISAAFLDRLTQGKGRVIITASDANEVSVEKDELRHGVFTYYLLEALRGKGDLDGDGMITVDEVYRYVSLKVPQATGQDQHPVKKGEMRGQIILGVVK